MLYSKPPRLKVKPVVSYQIKDLIDLSCLMPLSAIFPKQKKWPFKAIHCMYCALIWRLKILPSSLISQLKIWPQTWIHMRCCLL